MNIESISKNPEKVLHQLYLFIRLVCSYTYAYVMIIAWWTAMRVRLCQQFRLNFLRPLFMIAFYLTDIVYRSDAIFLCFCKTIML